MWVDWFRGGKSILVTVSPGYSSYPLCPTLLIFFVKQRQEIIQTAFIEKTKAARDGVKKEIQNIHCQNVSQLG